MTAGAVHTITVEVWRLPERNKFGDTNHVLHHEIEGCVMAPRYSSEVTENRSTTIIGFSLFGPPGADILATDRIKAPDGNTYRVVGEAASWTSPYSGWSPGFEAALERIT